MEKTWEIREKELREQIAAQIEGEIEMMMPPVDEVEFAIYNAATRCAEIARGDNASS